MCESENDTSLSIAIDVKRCINYYFFAARYHHDAYSNDGGYPSPYDTFQGGPGSGGPGSGPEGNVWGPSADLQHSGFITPDKITGYPPSAPCFTGTNHLHQFCFYMIAQNL